MRLPIIAALLAALPFAAAAAPTWQIISSEPGKRIELDSTSIKRDGNTVQAQSRVVLEKELSDFKSGLGYRIIEAVTRYDCGTRSANTTKRIFRKNESQVIREEDLKGNDLPVRSGTLDDKVLREVCRPPRENQAELAKRANEAAGELKQANEALLKKEMARPDKPAAVKAADAENTSIPSIRPNLKPAAATRETPPPPLETAHAPRAQPAPRPRKPTPRPEGYMLEFTHSEPAVQHAHIHWSYEGPGGPENWAGLDPKNRLCGTGQRQSPIDIRDGVRVDLEPIRFDYKLSNFRIVDNGHTVQVNVGPGSSLAVMGRYFDLVQFHFHRPSEERINGKGFEMVVHLVHKDLDGRLAVVAVLIERGKMNPVVQTLWNNLPLEKNVDYAPDGVSIDLDQLLPGDRSYYTYMGSLTTPPCSEGVLWMVMKQPAQLSADQIGIFARLYPMNARPIQSVRGRMIKESR